MAPATPRLPAPAITSEVGRLLDVIVHRPGAELRRLTPANKAELLFDELVWVSKAQEEHDAFVEVLRAEGVRVHRLDRLLADVLAVPDVRREAITALATEDSCGVELVDRVRAHLDGMAPGDLAAHLIGGVTLGDVPGAGDGFAGAVLGPTAFLVPPLPNAVFTRDPSAWIGSGVLLSPMRRQARRPERVLWRLVYRHHPDFTGAVDGIWYGDHARDHVPATIEGGDVLVLSASCVAVGVSERTHPFAVENLAASLFTRAGVERVLAIELPKGRQTMHLDTVLTLVDRDVAVLWPRVRTATVYRLEPGAGGGPMNVTVEPHLAGALADALGAERLRLVPTAEDEILTDREQWDDGNNTLALRPGVVVAYERNVDTNQRLADAGIEVREIPASELPRGRGGPRCMSCPIVREAP